MKLAASSDEREPAVAAATVGLYATRGNIPGYVSTGIYREKYEACGREKRFAGHRSSVYVCTPALADPHAYNDETLAKMKQSPAKRE